MKTPEELINEKDVLQFAECLDSDVECVIIEDVVTLMEEYAEQARREERDNKIMIACRRGKLLNKLIILMSR